MYNRRRARVLLAMLVLTALVLVTVDFRSEGSDGSGPLGTLRGMASAVLGPIQDGLSTLISPVGDAVSSFGGLFDARAENEQLRAQLEALEERRLSYEDVLRQNEDLRGLLDIAERNEFTMAAAQVIAAGPSNYEWTVTIDVGSSDGVQRDMPVISGAGLVGRVIQTTSRTSRVLLAIDPNFRAATRQASTGEVGTLQGDGGSPMIFEPLDPELELQAGDEIVTSAYSNGVFPAGIPVGTVATVSEIEGLLTRQARVRPFVDFTRLDVVAVVLHAPATDLPADEINPDLPFDRPSVDVQASEVPLDPPLVTPTPSETPSDDETSAGAAEPTPEPTGDGST